MDWKTFEEPYKEDLSEGKRYRERMLGDLDAFLEKETARADRRRAAFVSPEKMAASRETYRRRFIRMLGFPLTRPGMPRGRGAEREEVREEGDYLFSRMRVEICPGFWIYGIYAENRAPGRHPFVLAQHGGGGTPEVANGWVMNSANYTHIARRARRAGANVFSLQTYLWSAEYYGVPYDRPHADATLRQLGGSVTALELFMITRAIDFFSARPEVDPERIGMVGLSYGGMHTLTAAAVDPRIKSAYSSCFFNDRAKINWNDWSHFGQLSLFKDAEVGGLIAPRALYIEVGADDPLFPAEAASREAARLAEFYRAAGAEEKFAFRAFPGVHELSPADDGFEFLFEHL